VGRRELPCECRHTPRMRDPVRRGLSVLSLAPLEYWIPAFAGMTSEGVARIFIRRSFAFPRRELDAGVEASGPHDFAVRVGTFRQSAPPASIASLPALMTLRNAPLSGWDGRPYAPDLPNGEREIFLAGGTGRPKSR
jgi:hypothetical protein